jgi:large subunit ribosomal protein L6
MFVKKSIKIDVKLNLSFCILNSKKFFLYKKDDFLTQYYFCPKEIFFEKKKNEIIFFSKTNNFLILDNFFKQFKELFLNLIKKTKKKLIIKGLGYKCFFSDDKKNLIFKIGYSHLIKLIIPKTIISIGIEKTFITLEGYDSIILGNFCKRIKELKPLDIYKGKGIRYKTEFIKLKPVKKTK